MIIVTGNVLVKTEYLNEAITLCQQHVARSLSEPGCLSHAFYAAPDNPHSLFFFEEWSDNDAIQAHFAVPASQQFVATLTQLCAQPPQLSMYSADKIKRQ